MNRRKVVIAGGGFAGVQLARHLNRSLYDVVLIDKVNHHQFQPLFYQVATSQIEPSSISFPLRHIFRNSRKVQIRMAELKSIRPEEQLVDTTIGTFSYDYLVLAVGCRTNFFGNASIEQHALTLKSTYDAITIRNHILDVFEQVVSADETSLSGLLNIVIVGAGPTGVELAGAFAEIKRYVLPGDYPDIDFSRLSIYLIEGGDHTLPSMSDHAREASKMYLEKMGVVVLTNAIVSNYGGEVLTLKDGSSLLSKTVIWAAGVTGNPVSGVPAEALGPGNRILVNRYNEVDGMAGVFAIGDIALMRTPIYPKGHPQLANVAINQGRRLAKNLKARDSGKQQTEYEYRDLGSMATIGTHKAVVDLPFMRFKGFFAWLIWMFLHLMLILSVRNKLIIFINWAWAYVTRNSSLRLILTPRPRDSGE